MKPTPFPIRSATPDANAVRLIPIVGRIVEEAVERAPAWFQRFPTPAADDGLQEP